MTQVTSSGETTITTGNSSGNFTVNGLAAGSSYIFKLYDASCNSFLTSTQVSTPANPGQLTCSANVSSANIADSVISPPRAELRVTHGLPAITAMPAAVQY